MPMNVAFLRAINVGGNNMLPMKKLSEILTGMGFERVKTHLQSGNVVFEPPAGSDQTGLTDAIEDAIEAACGFRPRLILRTRDEMSAVVRANTLITPDTNPSRMIVVFLRDQPQAAAIALLEPERFPEERFMVVGREMYVVYGDGMASSKFLQTYYERRLGTIGTARNWNTVNKVLQLMQE